MAKDIFHNVVRTGLEKEGWIITDDPLEVEVGGVEVYIDLGAEKLLAAERSGEKIAVEIKSFIAPSHISSFHLAVGQFFNYRVALEAQESDRVLYLAVPLDVYLDFFQKQFVQLVIQQSQLKLIVYDSLNEVITEWKK